MEAQLISLTLKDTTLNNFFADMKKFLILFSLFFIISCGVTNNLQKTVNNYTWFAVNMKPSQVNDGGAVFYSQTLKNGEIVSVYYDCLKFIWVNYHFIVIKPFDCNF